MSYMTNMANKMLHLSKDLHNIKITILITTKTSLNYFNTNNFKLPLNDKFQFCSSKGLNNYGRGEGCVNMLSPGDEIKIIRLSITLLKCLISVSETNGSEKQ